MGPSTPSDDPPPSDGGRAASKRPPGDLFRQEAVAEQQDRWLGTVLLVPKVSHTVYTSFTALIVAAVLGLFAFGEYTRKARIGRLAGARAGADPYRRAAGGRADPGAGAGGARGRGRNAARGVVGRAAAARRSGATQGEVVRQLRARRDSLRAERGRHRALFAAAGGDARAAARGDRGRGARPGARRRRCSGQRLALAERALARQRELRGRGIATEQNLLEAEEDALDQAAGAAGAGARAHRRSRAPGSSSRRSATSCRCARRCSSPTTDREIAAARPGAGRGRGGARDRHHRAARPGPSPALRAAAGEQRRDPDAPLMTLVPAGARLEARLFGPSRAIGFVRPGPARAAALRGLPAPEVRPVRRHGEERLAQHGRAGGARRGDGGAAAGPRPRASRSTASPSSSRAQTATAYGEAVPLQPGMQLEADVLIETRRVYQWVLDPLHSLTGRERGMNATEGLQFGWGRRLPVVLQTEAAECGLACLAMIASYHGHHADPTALRRRFGFSLKGATLKDADRGRRPHRPRLAPACGSSSTSSGCCGRPASCTGTSTISSC